VKARKGFHTYFEGGGRLNHIKNPSYNSILFLENKGCPRVKKRKTLFNQLSDDKSGGGGGRERQRAFALEGSFLLGADVAKELKTPLYCKDSLR